MNLFVLLIIFLFLCAVIGLAAWLSAAFGISPYLSLPIAIALGGFAWWVIAEAGAGRIRD